MWFKQVTFYPINAAALPETDETAEKLSTAAFAPPQGLDRFGEGFAPPLRVSPELLFAADGTWRVSLKRAEKVLPSGVIRDILDEKINEIQQAEARKVGRKEKQDLKEQITDDLLPRAFVRSGSVQAVCDTRRGLLLVNNTAAKAEHLLTKLREALGGLEARLPETVQSPSSLMTDWLLGGGCAAGFELGDMCELKGHGDSAPVVKVSKQDLTAGEVVQHAKNGKTVTRLGLVWRERIAFVLTQDFALKRVEFLDVMQEEASAHGDDEASFAFASQLLMAEAIGTLIEELVAHLGGWKQAA